MAFMRYPGKFYFTPILSCYGSPSVDLTELYIGIWKDSSWFLFQWNGKYCLAQRFLPKVYRTFPNGYEEEISFTDKICEGFRTIGSTYPIYYSGSLSSWLCRKNAGLTDHGAGGLPAKEEGYYSLRGTGAYQDGYFWFDLIRNGSRYETDVIKLRYEFPHYELTGTTPNKIAGVYQGKDGLSGEKIVGTPVFSDGNTEYPKTFSVTDSGSMDSDSVKYGAIHRSTTSSSLWIIGTEQDASGWWQGPEPSRSNEVEFVRKNADGSSSGEIKTIRFSRFALPGDLQMSEQAEKKIYLGEVAIWR